MDAHFYPATTGTIQITPEERTRNLAALPPALIPLVAIADWKPAGDGTYRPVARVHERFVMLKELERLFGIPYRSLRRLAVAGFVASRQVTPGTLHIEIGSLWDHLAACQDEEFWTEKRRARWSEAIAIYH